MSPSSLPCLLLLTCTNNLTLTRHNAALGCIPYTYTYLTVPVNPLLYLPALFYYIIINTTRHYLPCTNSKPHSLPLSHHHSGPSSRATLCCFPLSFHHENEDQKEEEEEIKRSSPILFFFTSNDTAKHTIASKLHLLKKSPSRHSCLCVVCLCRKDTVREEEEKEGKRDSYDSDKGFLFPKLSLFLSLSLYSHIYTHTPGRTFPDSKGQREHCIALHYKIKTIDPPASFPLCA